MNGSTAVMAGFGAIWVTKTSTGSVQRVNPLTNKVVSIITVGSRPRFLATGEGGVWVLNQFDGTVSRIDPKTNKVVATIEAGVVGDGGDISAGEGGVWVRGAVVLLVVIDPATNKVVKRFGPAQGSGAVRAGAGQVWVSAHDTNRIWALNASLKYYGQTINNRFDSCYRRLRCLRKRIPTRQKERSAAASSLA